ncbi:MRPS35 (YGR165W) [Zygosaccharomyces parabailii]|uniref:ZYBA0S12-02476g1_1 n=1 Tax=Zygosaccharomyces bailii (strain CLIB 213 / ATCC 58445 / CBS 680 / BCRC 21525 / NBRC 1098 / NCYC 1416 / NRRL Y-2227) TaxID=1333698 RepID=A0A8J2TBU9_ZYGB2|nr:MRPS35 (YGR165W) [Zygosaccharomyces parabailii]CDF91593.1 ZYBA0S12-02476g1_1 [Zygosaccharomyces bailii CLIB 213]
MLSLSGHGSGFATSVVIYQQVRNISRRRIAYPFYPFKRLGKQHPKKHDTNLKSAMRQFLGPRNYKGEYVMNKYYSVPDNHLPNYIKPDLERGQSLINPITADTVVEKYDGSFGEVEENRRLKNLSEKRLLQPFPGNTHCRTNYVINEDLRLKIYNEIQIEGLSTQEVSQNYGLKIPRVEAIVKLVEIEQKWEKNNRITSDLKSLSSTLYKMFPVFQPESNTARENLSEIPVPQKALASRFLTLAESEPFGPVDAAKVLELEPAAQTLEKLGSVGEHAANHKVKVGHNHVVYGEVREGDRSILKFTKSRVGKVGHRYGAGIRDNKKDRKIGFNEVGQMVYI